MIELFQIFLHLALSKERKAEEAANRIRADMFSRMRPEHRLEADAVADRRILQAALQGVRLQLSEPETVELRQCAIYDGGDGKYIVGALVASRNLEGTEVCNSFVVLVDSAFEPAACELIN